MGLNKLLSPGEGGRFLLKGTRNQFPGWGPRLWLHRWDPPSTRLPLKKQIVLVLSSTKPSALSGGYKGSVPCPKWVDMSWQVPPTPFIFSVKCLITLRAARELLLRLQPVLEYLGEETLHCLSPTFIIEPHNILYNSYFFFLTEFVQFSSPPANPFSCKPSNALREPTTALIQKSRLPFRPVEQYSEVHSSSSCWFNLLNTRRIIPSAVFWNRLIRSARISQITWQSLKLRPWGRCLLCTLNFWTGTK